MAELHLSSPWVNFYREIEALFKEDETVRVGFDENACEIRLDVESTVKAEALTKLLPAEKTFGTVTVKVTVIPANTEETKSNLFELAFTGNPAVSYMQDVESPFGKFTYVVFNKQVVQYFNDDLSDINGLRSTLYQDIAKDVFGEGDGIYFCTDTDPDLEKPLGEWP